MTDNYIQWKDWSAADFGRFDQEEERYYRRELEVSGLMSVRGLRVGELGYGNGSFAGWVHQAGGHWVGREALPELAQRAADAGFDVIAPEAPFSAGLGADALDLIVAFDVIEHLEVSAVRSFLKECRSVLKPGGLVLFRVPSGDSPFSSAIYNGDITHRTLLGSSAVRQLARQTGFEATQIRSPVLPKSGYGVRVLRRAGVSILQFVVFGFIRTVLMGNSSAVVSPNMIVVLKRTADL
jgi:SAM-dependent methyltransferase